MELNNRNTKASLTALRRHGKIIINTTTSKRIRKLSSSRVTYQISQSIEEKACGNENQREKHNVDETYQTSL